MITVLCAGVTMDTFAFVLFQLEEHIIQGCVGSPSEQHNLFKVLIILSIHPFSTA